MASQQPILIHEDSMNLLSLYTSPSLPNITLGLPAVPAQLNVSHYITRTQTRPHDVFTGDSLIPCTFRLQGNLVASTSLFTELFEDVQLNF